MSQNKRTPDMAMGIDRGDVPAEASAPDRHTHDVYVSLSCRDFVSLAYERMRRLAALIK